MKWITTKRPAALPLKPNNTSKASSAAVIPEAAKKPTVEKKAGALDFSKSKPKAEPAEPPAKKEPAPAKKPGTLDWSKGKTKPATTTPAPSSADSKPKQEEKVKVKMDEREESPPKAEAAPVAKLKRETTARPKSKQSTARPLSKQLAALAVDDSKPTEKAGSKRATPSVDDEEEEEEAHPSRNVKPKLESASSSSAESSMAAGNQGRLKKGRVVSDDEDEAPAKVPSKKRKSEPLSDDDLDGVQKSRVQKGKSAPKKRRASTDSELADMMNDEDEGEQNPMPCDYERLTTLTTEEEEEIEEQASTSKDDGGSDSAPEHVPFTKKIQGMPKKPKATGIDVVERKKKTKAPMGSNGKPKKRVIKTRVTKNLKGFKGASQYLHAPAPLRANFFRSDGRLLRL